MWISTYICVCVYIILRILRQSFAAQREGDEAWPRPLSFSSFPLFSISSHPQRCLLLCIGIVVVVVVFNSLLLLFWCAVSFCWVEYVQMFNSMDRSSIRAGDDHRGQLLLRRRRRSSSNITNTRSIHSPNSLCVQNSSTRLASRELNSSSKNNNSSNNNVCSRDMFTLTSARFRCAPPPPPPPPPPLIVTYATPLQQPFALQSRLPLNSGHSFIHHQRRRASAHENERHKQSALQRVNPALLCCVSVACSIHCLDGKSNTSM